MRFPFGSLFCLSHIFMQFVVYILYSKSSGKTYTGMSTDLITRFKFHNEKSTKGFTTRYALACCACCVF
ncbi:GIY-YIG nuclease family protein [Belliella filtrata]|uniref:GIY-YIG nuclease family protein n=1 Tax=Belliella filtrata TaxID=2923435 RepID=UPI00374CD94D